MRVWLRQQGGFIGWTIDLVSLDSERMSSEAGRALQRAIATCGFFGLPAVVTREGVGTERLTYQISVEDGARRHRVFFGDDDDCPRTAPLRRLRDALVGLQTAGRR
jgi:hypothetical protein